MAVLAMRGSPGFAAPEHRPRLAITHPSVPMSDMPRWASWLIRELEKLGYVEGQTLTLGFFSAEGPIAFEHQLATARKVVGWHPDVISFTSGTVLALKAATSTIPIVGGVGDPIDWGITDNMARLYAICRGRQERARRLECLRNQSQAMSLTTLAALSAVCALASAGLVGTY
jgi:ABC-type uncharacterized transport system substrate-binding protein